MPLVKRRVLILLVVIRGMEYGVLIINLHERVCVAISLNCENLGEPSGTVLIVAGLGYRSHRSEMLH